MIVKSIKLKQFRNYKNQTVEFSSSLNVLRGKNAQGKTNILEAIYLCAIGKSLRAKKEKELIGFNYSDAKVDLSIKKQYNSSKIEIYLFKNQKKVVKINSLPIRKMGELMGEFNAVYFSPDELRLVKECPEDRRKFMDISLSQVSKDYFYSLGRYEKVLLNRNKLLKSTRDINEVFDTIGIWNEQLSTLASKIIYDRINFLNKLSHYANLAHYYLSGEKESLVLDYSGIKKDTKEEIKKEILSRLEKSIQKDFDNGWTGVGPHRDDIKIFVNDIDIKTYGSQGQQRTVALSLKLAELEIIKEQTGEYPVLLLDDVLSELDSDRRKKLINFTKKTQTILSCNDFESDSEYDLFEVKNGEVVKIKKSAT